MLKFKFNDQKKNKKCWVQNSFKPKALSRSMKEMDENYQKSAVSSLAMAAVMQKEIVRQLFVSSSLSTSTYAFRIFRQS